MVDELTSNKEEIKNQGKANYLSKKVVGMSNYGLVLKLCDRLDNIEDLNNANNASFKIKYKKETEKIISTLKEKRELTNTQKRIIKDIENVLSKVIIDKEE